MAEEKRITISTSLNGNEIVHIARNSSGNIFARELTLEALQKAIKTYQEPPPPPVEEEPAEAASAASDAATGKPKKKLLANKLSEKVQAAEPAEKKSFWDKLK